MNNTPRPGELVLAALIITIAAITLAGLTLALTGLIP